MLWEYILLTTLAVFILSYIIINRHSKCERNVCIVVLGDLGRSPRMQYHCISLATEGYSVDVVAYSGSMPHRELILHEKIEVHYMTEPPPLLAYMPHLLRYALKTVWQSLTLGMSLLLLPKCAFHIVQNPPCIPTLAVTWLICVLRSSQLVIDWHNYAYTILALSLRPTHSLVRFSKWYERAFGSLAYASICVTKAMQTDLLSKWNIKCHVLYDRPPVVFQPCATPTSHQLFTKLSLDYPCFSGRCGDDTRFTEIADGQVRWKGDRPALIVSSTSWTEDEDFSILLEALDSYENAAENVDSETKLPDLVVAITGKGPQKAHYRQEISGRQWRHVTVCLPWLEPHDYPLLLASADLGVCLHKSSSGLDLPMKVVDMFGCGLPVCAINFPCLGELVCHEENGLVFDSPSQLANQIQGLLRGFPDTPAQLSVLRANVQSFRRQRWHDNWKRVVLPLLTIT